MARIRQPKKVKEPVRLRMKALSNGSKSLYLDIYRNGKRTYEYLKLYIIPDVDTHKKFPHILIEKGTICTVFKNKREKS